MQSRHHSFCYILIYFSFPIILRPSLEMIGRFICDISKMYDLRVIFCYHLHPSCQLDLEIFLFERGLKALVLRIKVNGLLDRRYARQFLRASNMAGASRFKSKRDSYDISSYEKRI